MTEPSSVTNLLPLHPKTFHILLALNDAPRNGYQIMTQAEAATHGRISISPGTLYETLSRFERRGLVSEAPATTRRRADGRGQRFFKLTDMGRRLLRAEAERLAADVELARGSGVLKEMRA